MTARPPADARGGWRGALSGFLAWRSAPALPATEQVRTWLAPALPPGTDPTPQRWDFRFADSPKFTDPAWVYEVSGTDEYEFGPVFFDLPMPDPLVVVAGRRSRTR